MACRRNALQLLTLLAFCNAIACVVRADDRLVWGDKGSFPDTMVELLERRDQIWSSPDSRNAEDRREVESAINALVSSVDGEEVRARLSVMSNQNGVVSLLPDVTYGFPTRTPQDITLHSSYRFLEHSTVVLEETGAGANTKRLNLRIGEDIKESEAKYLSWNDKVLVKFKVDQINLRKVLQPPKSPEEKIKAMYQTVVEERQKGPFCTVKISGLEFLKAELYELVNSHRTWLWPGPGTLPYSLASYTGSSGNGPAEMSAFSDYASLNRFQGRAVFRFLGVRGRGDEFEFSSGPMWSPTEEAEVMFGGYSLDPNLGTPKRNRALPLRVRFSEFTDEEVEKLNRNPEVVLLCFDASVLEGVSYPNSYWNGVLINLYNFRLGTEAEFTEAMRILPGLDDMATQYELAVQNQADLLIAAADKKAADIAKEEAERNQQSTLEMLNEAFTQTQETPEENPQEKPAELSKWQWIVNRMNYGVYTGLAMTSIGSVSWLWLFVLRRR